MRAAPDVSATSSAIRRCPVSTSTASAMRCRKRKAPSVTPTAIATARSSKMVSRNVTRSTAASPREVRSSARNSSFSTMFQATTASTRAEAGERDVGGQRRRHQHEQQQVERVQHPGDRTARAGAHVGRGARDRAGDADAAERHRGRCWRRLAPPARSSSDACGRSCRRRRPPRAGIRSRPGSRWRRHPGRRPASWRGRRPGASATAGCAAARRSECRRWRHRDAGESVSAAVTATAISSPGHFGRSRRRPRMMAMASSDSATVAGLIVWICVGDGARSWAGGPPARCAMSRPSRSFNWLARMMIGNSGREADDDRQRDVLDVGAEPQEADRDHHHARPSASPAPGRHSRAARRCSRSRR